ncbi:MAG: hypothetical protein H6R31_45, partial [Methanomicrobia archaeon]|nr:hypothetical protein [Methanomicrobia archaeon]
HQSYGMYLWDIFQRQIGPNFIIFYMFYILTIELNEMSYQDLVIQDGLKTIDIRMIAGKMTA